MKPDQAVTRARSCLARGIVYRNGAGGIHPEADSPADSAGECDCSGFVLWALGRSRYDGTLWWDTSRIADDALGAHKNFARVELEKALPGDVLVYGDRRINGVHHEGHIGLVTAIGPDGPLHVIHCSKGAWTLFHDAIHEDGPEKWLPRGIVARCLWLERLA